MYGEGLILTIFMTFLCLCICLLYLSIVLTGFHMKYCSTTHQKTAFTLMCDTENIVGKGSTAFYTHELSRCNKRRGCKDSIYTELVLTLSSIYTCFNTMKKKTLGKHCGRT